MTEDQGATKDAGLIKPDDTETQSMRYARYLPFWVQSVLTQTAIKE